VYNNDANDVSHYNSCIELVVASAVQCIVIMKLTVASVGRLQVLISPFIRSAGYPTTQSNPDIRHTVYHGKKYKKHISNDSLTASGKASLYEPYMCVKK